MISLKVETTNHRTFQTLLHNVKEQLKLKPGTSGQQRHIWPAEYRPDSWTGQHQLSQMTAL